MVKILFIMHGKYHIVYHGFFLMFSSDTVWIFNGMLIQLIKLHLYSYLCIFKRWHENLAIMSDEISYHDQGCGLVRSHHTRKKSANKFLKVCL